MHDAHIPLLLEPRPARDAREDLLQHLVGELGYNHDQIAFDQPIILGGRSTRVAVAVYHTPLDCAFGLQARLRFIGEIAPEARGAPSEAFLGLVRQLGVEGGVWTNGARLQVLRAQDALLVEWPALPRRDVAWDDRTPLQKTDLVVPVDIRAVLDRCHDAMYRSGIDSEDVVLDMVRIILAKIEDERRPSSWCAFALPSGDTHDPEARSAACARVRALWSDVRDLSPGVYGPHEAISAGDDQLVIVIGALQRYAVLRTPADVLGLAYEVYLSRHVKGDRGQYFTNRLVARAMAAMLAPNDHDVILDPACGTGGLLSAVAQHLLADVADPVARAERHTAMHARFFGVDIAPRLVKAARAGMALYDPAYDGIVQGNSLAPLDALPSMFRERVGLGIPTMVMANPPFGNNVGIRDRAILAQYQLGRAWRRSASGGVEWLEGLNTKKGVAPEVLFVERCIQWVCPGGTVGLIVSKGQLDNDEALAMRHFILDSCVVLAVLSLPMSTFAPFTVTKAAMLVLQRRKELGAASEDGPIFMGMCQAIGQDRKGERMLRANPAGGAPVLDEDLSQLVAAYRAYHDRGELPQTHGFLVARADLNPQTVSLNPILYSPERRQLLEEIDQLAHTGRYTVQPLGALGRVYLGERFKRPYATHDGITHAHVRKLYSPTALTQVFEENVKYLDLELVQHADLARQITISTMREGQLLISAAGTLARITYVQSHHAGHVASNDAIRVEIDDPALRAYVYQFLKSPLGQRLLSWIVYGTTQDHINVDLLAEMRIPIPRDSAQLKVIQAAVEHMVGVFSQIRAAATTAAACLADVLPLASAGATVTLDEDMDGADDEEEDIL